jgi:GH43 family beta-xylosidase
VKSFRNPVLGGGDCEDRGDPFVMKWMGRYYLYHSGETSGPKGISVYTSDTLIEWTFAGYAFIGVTGTDYEHDLWAPEVVYHDGTFYMYVAATRADVQRQTRHPLRDLLEVDIDLVSEEDRRRIYVATATDPIGPFRLIDRPLVDGWAIDGHVFRSDTGQWWFFYNVRYRDALAGEPYAGTAIVVDRMLSPTELAKCPREVIVPSEQWEGDARHRFYWNEAPTVVVRRERHYVMYSGGFFWDTTYGVGVASTGHLTGPWTKHSLNPILQSGERIGGPGHHSVTTAPDGATPCVAYHGYCAGEKGRKIHVEELFWCADRPAFRANVPAEEGQVLPDEPWFDADVPWWRAELWVDGPFSVGSTDFEHPGDYPSFVEVEQRPTGATVRRDRRLIWSGSTLRPRFGGSIVDERVSSYLDDVREIWLSPGETHTVPWGSAAPVQVSLAVRGSGEIRSGTRLVRFDEPQFKLLTFECRDLSAVVVAAGSKGAHLADVTVRRSDG